MSVRHYSATLHVRQPRQPEGFGVTEVSASLIVQVETPIARCGCGKPACLACQQAGRERHEAAVAAADKEFRALGLGTVMDLKEARVSIDAVPF